MELFRRVEECVIFFDMITDTLTNGYDFLITTELEQGFGTEQMKLVILRTQ